MNKQEQQQQINKNQKNVGPIKKERLSLDQHNNNNNNNQAYNSQQPLNLSVEATQFNNHHHLSNNEENLENPSIQV